MFSGARIEGLARVDATKTVSEAVQHEEALTAVNIPVLPLGVVDGHRILHAARRPPATHLQDGRPRLREDPLVVVTAKARPGRRIRSRALHQPAPGSARSTLLQLLHLRLALPPTCTRPTRSDDAEDGTTTARRCPQRKGAEPRATPRSNLTREEASKHQPTRASPLGKAELVVRRAHARRRFGNVP